jgi:hypothetical protein
MIDTLRLNLVDCEIKRSCPLTVQQGNIDYSTGLIYNENDLFIDNSGKIIKGSKAYLNDDKFNLTINPTIESEKNDFNQNKIKVKKFHRIDEKIQPDLFDWESEEEVKGIFLTTSLPRLLNESNLKTLSFDEQNTALKNLELKLKEYGIKTNIFNANLSRIDTFTNITTELPFYNYSNLFSLMDCSRMKSIGYGNESFLWRNGNQELMIYDKKKELQDKKPNLKFRTHTNVMRLENRLLKKRKILSSIKFKTVKELYDNYSDLKNFHKKELEKKIFKYDIDEIGFLTSNKTESELRYCKSIFGSKWLDRFFQLEGMKEIIRNFDIDYLFNLIEELDQDKKPIALRVKKSRVKKIYSEMKFHLGIFETKFNKGILKSNVDLYNELKTKFYKEVA